MAAQPQTYNYDSAAPSHSHSYVIPIIVQELRRLGANELFDIGCGNGSGANLLSKQCSVTGVDPSEAGIAQARAAFPDLRFEQGSAYDDLAARFGAFDAVVSIEVIGHLLDPRLFARRAFDLVRPGGALIIATPFHGYIKNLALALCGRMDAHFNALWDHGQIKFWSVATLSELLCEAGFDRPHFRFAGRVAPLAKTMIAIARRPDAPPRMLEHQDEHDNEKPGDACKPERDDKAERGS